jgi:hypothetical protein
MCNINILYAQTEPEPYWNSDRNKLKEGNNFGYAVGRGQGKDRDEAEKIAFQKAIDDAIMQLRHMEIPEHEIGSFLTSIKAGRTNENARLVCSCYFKINNNDDTYQVYALYRFKKHIYNEWGDKDEYIDCDKIAFEKQRKEYYKHFSKPKVPAKIENELFGNIGYGVSYGIFGMSIGGRHGGIVGFGYQAGIGLGEGSKYWHYSGGLKFYPYKGLFISANYGTAGMGKPQIQNADDGYFSYKDNYVQHGWSFLIGADVWLGKKGIINVGIGTSQISPKEWKFPVFDAGIGFVSHF